MKAYKILSLVFAVALLVLKGAKAEETKCHKIEEIEKSVLGSGGTARPLTTRELDFARGIYVMFPGGNHEFPMGKSGLWIEVKGTIYVVFTQGGMGCGWVNVSEAGAKDFEKLEVGGGEPS